MLTGEPILLRGKLANEFKSIAKLDLLKHKMIKLLRVLKICAEQ